MTTENSKRYNNILDRDEKFSCPELKLCEIKFRGTRN
jgi:hypothetical protein